jgi:hypothetical protein
MAAGSKKVDMFVDYIASSFVLIVLDGDTNQTKIHLRLTNINISSSISSLIFVGHNVAVTDTNKMITKSIQQLHNGTLSHLTDISLHAFTTDDDQNFQSIAPFTAMFSFIFFFLRA